MPGWSQERSPSTASIIDHKKVTIPAGTSIVLLLSGKLVGEASTERRVLAGKWRNPGNHDPPTLVVVQDLIIEGVKTIATGTKAQWAPVYRAAGLFNEPGEIGVSVDSVASVSGDSVPLVGTYSKTGKSSCAQWVGCTFPELDFWLHGDPGHVDAGLLLNAAVARDVEVNAEFTPSPAPAVSTLSVSRLHLYSTPTSITHEPQRDNPQTWIGIRLDGTRVGSLAPAEYGCVKVTPGKHWLKLGRDEFALDVQPGVERYVRVIPTSKRHNDNIVEETAGYKFESANLFPGRFRGELRVSCFVPLRELDPK
jgi:hypothetical protein